MRLPHRNLSLAFALFAAASTRVSCALAAPAPVAVAITKFAYTPADLVVAPGATVTWTNRDETPHTVTSADGALASPALDTGDHWQRRFDAEGDYVYTCTLHPFMMGTVHVRRH